MLGVLIAMSFFASKPTQQTEVGDGGNCLYI